MAGSSYIDLPCERCGSKKKVAKKWKEKIPTFTGTTVVEYSQIVCTNADCQKALEVLLEKEAQKREAVRLEKEAKSKFRKTPMHIAANISKSSSKMRA